MKFKFLLAALFGFFTLFATAQTDSTAQFSLLTCSPGTEVYATFGHTALRYQHPATETDIVFNYGVFRFNDNFLFNFVKGETYYELGVQQFEYFFDEYVYDQKGVIEQVLNLTPQEVEHLYDFLCENYEPQNRKYLYNFFYDNCATRVRDIFAAMFADSLQWRSMPPTSYTDSLWISDVHNHLETSPQPSFRSLIHKYTSRNSWLQCGIDLVLGVPADKAISEFETMFLPDCLFLLSQEARIVPPADIAKERKLVSKTNSLLKAHPLPQTPLLFTPNIFMWLLTAVFIAIACVEWRTRKHVYWLDSLLCFTLGILGILTWFLSFISIHPAVFPNIHVLWASPLHILFAILWLVPHMRKYLRWYVKVYAIIFAAMCVLFFVPLQYIPCSFVAVFVIMLSRTMGIVRATLRK
ncbi:MAG: DUF4105 domain-containing protein [Bacteroidales bacterium]|jgi:hypothetical protein|nr:DUF4105 domain-containing protein [Bacteroidales bacterium]